MNKPGLCYWGRLERENKFYDTVCKTGFKSNIETICNNAFVSRGTFFNYYKVRLDFDIYVINRLVLDFYHKNHEASMDELITDILKVPDSIFLSTLSQCIEDNRTAIVINEDQIRYYYGTANTEDYMLFLRRACSVSFTIELLKHYT